MLGQVNMMLANVVHLPAIVRFDVEPRRSGWISLGNLQRQQESPVGRAHGAFHTVADLQPATSVRPYLLRLLAHQWPQTEAMGHIVLGTFQRKRLENTRKQVHCLSERDNPPTRQLLTSDP